MFLFNESAVCFHKITAIICISAPACLLLYRRAGRFRPDSDAKIYRMKEYEILQEIMRDAKIGWWQADRKRRMFHISEGLRDLLGLATCQVSYEEFRDMISPAYRDYAFASVGVRGGDFNEERLYPLRGRNGEIWCYWKLLHEETTEDGGMLLTGYFRVGDPPLEKVNSPERQQINDLLDGIWDVNDAFADIAQKTKRLARKQMGWFGRDPRIHWLQALNPKLVDNAMAIIAHADAGDYDPIDARADEYTQHHLGDITA